MDQKKKKKLKLGNPLTRTMLYDAYPLEIVTANGDDYMEWFLSTYIQISVDDFDDYKRELFFIFSDEYGLDCPFLNRQNMSKKALIQSVYDIHNFIKGQIDADYCFCCLVDEHFIPNRIVTGTRHFIHDIMIYGYDDDLQQYNILGYNVDGRYAEATCTYQQFLEGFMYYDENDDQDYYDKIRLYSYNHKEKYKFNIKLVKLFFQDYVEGKNTFLEYSPYEQMEVPRVYGVKTYQKIINRLHGAKLLNEKIDMRIFRLIMEHKTIMGIRFEYINEHITELGDLITQFEEVKKLAKICFNTASKYNLMRDMTILDRLESNLKEIKEKEIYILNEVISRI